MAQIDVTDVLSDPDFVDPMTIINRKPTVNEFGENTLAESGSPTVGSIQAASGKTLQRLPEALRVINVQSFWVKGKIVSDGSCQYPDILSFKGQRFAVQAVFDWTNWGAGWCEGTCVREKPSV